MHNCFPLIISPFCTRCILVNGTVISQATPAFIRSPPNDSALPHFLLNKMNSSPALSKACFYFSSFIFVLAVMDLKGLGLFLKVNEFNTEEKLQAISLGCCNTKAIHGTPVLGSCLLRFVPDVMGYYWEEPASMRVASLWLLCQTAACCVELKQKYQTRELRAKRGM